MTGSLQGRTVLVVGRGSGIARAVVTAARAAGGTIDTGAWDALGAEGKAKLYEHVGETNPARRIGTSDDIAGAVVFCLTSSFLTGVTLKVDGGQELV